MEKSVMSDKIEFKSKKEKFEVLNKALHLDTHLTYQGQGLTNLVNELYEDIKDKGLISGHGKLIKTQIHILICNLLRAQNNKFNLLAMDRAKNADTTDKNCRYKAKGKVIFKIVELVDALIKAKYLFQYKGYSDKEFGGYRTRIGCEDKLVQLFERHNAKTHCIVHPTTQESIIIRSNKKAVSYKDNRDSNRMRRELTAYNNVLRNNIIHLPTVSDPKMFIEEKAPYSFDGFKSFTVRSFNDDLTKGGRYYRNAWVSFSKNIGQG
jgi:hypothetical protein